MDDEAVLDPPEVAEAPVVTEAPAAPAAAALPAADAPTSMLDAISRELSRDEKGRFVGKDPAAELPPVVPGAAPTVAAKPADAKPLEPKPADDDVTAMPEGLGQKAQERFQKLATANREATEQIDTLTRQVSYVRDTFHEHQVKPEQFQQAAQVIGMMNRGDYRGALKVLDQQRAQISLALGEPLAGADALAGHQDLRQAVDSLEITEQRALELARLRQENNAVAQRQQQADQQREQSQAAEQEFAAAQTAVDGYCKRMAASDIDYPAIEEQLLPSLGDLLRGVPPKQWPAAVEAQYKILKRAATAFRRPQSTTVDNNPLRATGSASPQQAPGSMYEAMWNKPEPRA